MSNLRMEIATVVYRMLHISNTMFFPKESKEVAMTILAVFLRLASCSIV